MMRVLQVTPSLSACGGVENYLMNYFRAIDRKKVAFDFLSHDADPAKADFADEIRANGGRVYFLPPYTAKNVFSNQKKTEELFFRHPEYRTVHCHGANFSPFVFAAAIRFGVSRRILHSHQAAAADKAWHKLRNLPLLAAGNRRATHRAACSTLSGEYLFGKRPFTVIPNAVDTARFAFHRERRSMARLALGVGNAFVVGHIGRMCAQKNQLFLIEVFAAFLRVEPNALLLLAGTGETEPHVRAKAQSLGVSERVRFLGLRKDTAPLYAAMDAFCLPSLYEGLPVVGVEAQSAGLPLLVSDTVTEELGVLSTTKFLSLRRPAEEWAAALAKMRKIKRADTRSAMRQAGFDIFAEAEKLADFYLSMR